jgi:hypothetical protein
MIAIGMLAGSGPAAAAARTLRAVACCQPDLKIGTFGEHVYGTDGTNQIKHVKIAAGHTLIIHFKVENDGNAFEMPTVKAAAGGGPFHVTYISEFGDNVTADIEAGYSPGTYGPTADFTFRMEIKVAKSAKHGKHDFLLNASSGTTPSLVDALIVSAAVK